MNLKKLQQKNREKYTNEEGLVTIGKYDHEALDQLTLSTVQAVCDEILSLAPGFENQKTGEVTYDVGVQEWRERIINKVRGD